MAQKHLQLLRNNTPYTSYTAAYDALKAMTGATYADGTPIIARYNGNNDEIKTLLGIVNKRSGDARVDIINDVQESVLRAYTKNTGITGDITSDDSIQDAFNKLENRIADTSVKVVRDENDGNTTAHLTVTSADTATGDTFTLKLNDVASESALTAETAARKAVDGQDGQTYAVNSGSKYISGATSLNDADVKLDAAISGLSDAVNSISATSVSGESKVVIDVTQDKGKITATASNLTGVKLDGYAEGADNSGKVAATDTLGQALGKLQGQINGMDKAASAVDGQVVTTVTEADGKVTETKANVKDLQLGGYVKNASATGAISGTDTVNDALSKLENTVTANKIANADGSINVTTDTTGTDINVNIKSGEHVLAKDGNAGLYTNIAISSVTGTELTGLGTNVKEAYKLVGTDNTKLGEYIKIYKDSSISKIYLGYPTDTVDANSGTITSGATGESQSLNYVYHKEDGTYEMVHVDVSKFLAESEFASGVTAGDNGVVHGVVDPASEKDESNNAFLTVGEDGFKVSGIKDAIDTKINKLNVSDTADVNQYVSSVSESSGKISVEREYIVNAKLSGYTKSSSTSAETISTGDTLGTALGKLENNIEKVKGATTIVEEGTDNVHLNITSATSQETSATTYTITLTDVASDSALTAEIAARKAVDGQSGQTYAANTGVNYIGDATSLNNADVKLDAALKAEETDRMAIEGQSGRTYTANNNVNYIGDATSLNNADVLLDAALAEVSGNGVTVITSSNNSISATSSNADDGTTSYDLVTDTAKIQLSGYSATATGTPADGDTVNAAIAKLYNRGTITSPNNGITVSQANDASTTITLNVSTATAVAGSNDAKYAQADDGNAIQMKDDGIFVSSNWDCGTYDEPAGN